MEHFGLNNSDVLSQVVFQEMCQAVRAPGSNVTIAPARRGKLARAGAWLAASSSFGTSTGNLRQAQVRPGGFVDFAAAASRGTRGVLAAASG